MMQISQINHKICAISEIYGWDFIYKKKGSFAPRTPTRAGQTGPFGSESLDL